MQWANACIFPSANNIHSFQTQSTAFPFGAAVLFHKIRGAVQRTRPGFMLVVLSDFVKAYTAVPAVCKALEKLHCALEVIEAHRFNGSMCIASGDGYSGSGNAFVAAYLNISGLGKQATAHFPLEGNVLAPAYPFEILNKLFVGHKARVPLP